MKLTFVGRTPASAAGPPAGYSGFVKTSTSRAGAPGAGQGTRPTSANYWRIVARTLVSAASRLVSTLFQDCSEVRNFANIIKNQHRLKPVPPLHPWWHRCWHMIFSQLPAPPILLGERNL